MKRIMIAIAALFLAPASYAKTASGKREPAGAVRCQATALEAVKFIDKLGWGEADPDSIKIVSGKRDRLRDENFEIKSNTSDFTYKVRIFHDAGSEACIVTGIATN